jgi:hypothetical protein
MASINRRGLLGGGTLLPAAGNSRLARATIDPAALDLSRYAYVPSATTPDITVVDCAANRVHATLHGGLVASQAVMSRAAATLVLADAHGGTLAVFPTGHLDAPAVLPGARGIVGVYATWLDGIAFMPSAAERRVLVYDLDAIHRAGDIALPGTPARGAETPDSQTLYLPVSDPPRLLAMDGQTRRIAAAIDLPSPPLEALIAGASGLCH